MAVCCDPTAPTPLMIVGGLGFNGESGNHSQPSLPFRPLQSSYLLRHRLDDFLAPLELLLIRLQLFPQLPDALDVLGPKLKLPGVKGNMCFSNAS